MMRLLDQDGRHGRGEAGRPSLRRLVAGMIVALAAAGLPGPTLAQPQPGTQAQEPAREPTAPASPQPASPQPAVPQPAAPQPAAPATPAQAPAPGPLPAPALPPAAAPAQQAPAPMPAPAPLAPRADRNATLAGSPGDTMNVDPVTLPNRSALALSGQTTWDRGIETLGQVFRRLEAEAGKLGLQVAGRPLTHFIETDDVGFRYEAMLPVDRVPEAGAPLPADIRAGATPPGQALRFTHKAPYDDVDSTYEGITAYLDAKGLTVRDQFIEEYVSDLARAGEPEFEVNIYVQPR